MSCRHRYKPNDSGPTHRRIDQSSSASGAEIVAAALQDHRRARVLGTPSFGKGSLQAVEPLPGGYGLKFTIARFYRPNGKPIDGHGIRPDVAMSKCDLEPVFPERTPEYPMTDPCIEAAMTLVTRGELMHMGRKKYMTPTPFSND